MGEIHRLDLTFCALVLTLAGAASRDGSCKLQALLSLAPSASSWFTPAHHIGLGENHQHSSQLISLCADSVCVGAPLWAQKMTFHILVASDVPNCWLIGFGDKWRHTPEIHLIQFPFETRLNATRPQPKFVQYHCKRKPSLKPIPWVFSNLSILSMNRRKI